MRFLRLNRAQAKPEFRDKAALRLFSWGAMLLPVLTQAPGNVAANPAMVELQGSEIYQSCESYYVEVDRLKVAERHYLIKDASVAFIESTKSMEPRTKSEAFLLMECINLANGNVQFAVDEIRRVETEDDAFIDMAYNRASNKANAAAFEVDRRLEDEHDLALDVELGLESYRASLRQARALARQRTSFLLGDLLQPFDQVGYQAQYGSYGSGYNAGYAGFFQVAVIAAQAVTAFGGHGAGATPPSQTIAPGGSSVTLASKTGGSGWSNTGGSWTPAPPAGRSQPAPAAGSASTATAVDPTAPATAGEDSAVLESPARGAVAVAALPKAPKVDASCLDYRIVRQDVSFARVLNDCGVPVSFYWCWVDLGAQSCGPSYLSEVVAPGGFVEIAGPAPGQTRTANFVACNMISSDHVCEP